MFSSVSKIFVAFLVLATGCSGGSGSQEEQARSALAEGDYFAAIQVSTEAAQQARTASDKSAIWRFEQIRVEALARSGSGGPVLQALETLSGEFPAQVNAKLYLSLASYLHDAGDRGGAIDVLAAGDKRFSEEHETFVKAIDQLKQAGDLAPEEVEKLKALGYL